MDICGEGAAITREHLLRLASQGGVSPGVATDIIERMLDHADNFSRHAAGFPIRRATVQRMHEDARAHQSVL